MGAVCLAWGASPGAPFTVEPAARLLRRRACGESLRRERYRARVLRARSCSELVDAQRHSIQFDQSFFLKSNFQRKALRPLLSFAAPKESNKENGCWEALIKPWHPGSRRLRWDVRSLSGVEGTNVVASTPLSHRTPLSHQSPLSHHFSQAPRCCRPTFICQTAHCSEITFPKDNPNRLSNRDCAKRFMVSSAVMPMGKPHGPNSQLVTP
jgi:hypothetical protein